MDLKTYLADLPREDREQMAQACGTTLGHLQNVMYGVRPCSPELAVAIEQYTGRKVRRWDLRPDSWHLIWPELVKAKGAPMAAAHA